MRNTAFLCGLSAAILAGLTTGSAAQAPVKPIQIFEKTIEGMPTDKQQNVRLLTATLKSGEKSVRHTHQFPVTVYVLEGELTLVVKDQAPIVTKAGEAVIEQPGMDIYAMNSRTSGDAKVVIFYASKPQTPFLVPITN
jgi:quercetin dioxygenase-like cupin family protein